MPTYFRATTKPAAPPGELSRPDERRAHPLKRALWSWFFDTDLDTVEKLLITAQMILSAAVVVLNARLITVPPPYIQGWALVLPAPMWFFLLLSISASHVWARNQVDFCARQRCSFVSGMVCFALCGPLSSRAPTVLVIVLPLAVSFVVLAARLRRACKEPGSLPVK